MFDSILIANRGEIACRIARTCRRLGIASVAVYSEADRLARHVRECDFALPIGPAEAAASYLDAQAIVDAALASGAQAVHPGYGFLSEKTVLAELCARHGLGWIGPRPEVIRQMGSKIESKRLAQQAGVPTVPGYHGEDQSASQLLGHAEAIGWPVLIKASAGGGGRGMRRVDRAEDFQAQLEDARREALRAFGDERVLIEKLITRPRHLEVQLVGDRHGGLVHLFERECSIQRNYQKLIEEAPAAFLPPAVRQRLHENALLLGRAIGYDSAGTVEFVLDEGTDQPYFLEMNTRLQVEHPVTELITGLDLVELQIRVAAGEALPIAQDELRVHGHAIEARVNCEDPAHGWRPQLGRIASYVEPQAEGLRIDSGVQAGGEITPHYDSMIAKVIGFAATRATALRRLLEGLEHFELDGIGTNQAFLRDVLLQPMFQDRALTTRYLAEAFPSGWATAPEVLHGAIAAAAYQRLAPALALGRAGGDPWSASDGFRTLGRGSGGASAWIASGLSDVPAEVRLAQQPEGWRLEVGNESEEENEDASAASSATILHIEPAADGALSLRDLHGSRRYRVEPTSNPEDRTQTVYSGGQRLAFELWTRLEWQARPTAAAAELQGAVRANMPGLVTEVPVVAGQKVKAGDVVAVLDSMKLLYRYGAAVDGEVSAVGCKVGDIVTSGQLLVEITP